MASSAGRICSSPCAGCDQERKTAPLAGSNNCAAHQQNGYGTVYRILLPIPVPNVVGMAQATAESDITGAGLTVGAITQQTSLIACRSRWECSFSRC